MSAPDNQNLPLGATMTPRQVRILRVAVIVMGVLLILGFALVLGAIVYQASQLGKDPDAASTDAAVTGTPPAAVALGASPAKDIVLPVPAGATAKAVSLEGGRLAVHLKSVLGEEIAIIDLASGKVISRVRLKAE